MTAGPGALISLQIKPVKLIVGSTDVFLRIRTGFRFGVNVCGVRSVWRRLNVIVDVETLLRTDGLIYFCSTFLTLCRNSVRTDAAIC